jgi:ketosteroid isomerase-like protein
MEPDRSISADEARDLLGLALRAIVAGDARAGSLFTDDVVIDSPNMHVTSRAELEDQLGDRAGALTDVDLIVEGVGFGVGGVRVNWTASGNHTGAVLVNEDELFEASGRPVRLSASSIVTLRGGLISGLRTDYDDIDLRRQVAAQVDLRPRGVPGRGAG